MAERTDRKINSKTARSMYTWSHYRFRQFLKHKSREHPWSRVVEVREDYTSVTCGNCGALHGNLDKNKLYACSPRGETLPCGYHADRDANAARNILLRFLTERKVEPTFTVEEAFRSSASAGELGLPPLA